MADAAPAPKKSSSTATIVKVVLLVAVLAAIVSMWLHGQKLATEHARRLGKPEAEAGVLLPWHWDGDQWRSWLGSSGTAEVGSGR